MNAEKLPWNRIQWVGSIIITIGIVSLLLVNYFNGGVPRHHLLDNKDLPEISNWWGAIVLPVVSWILLGRIKRRVERDRMQTSKRAEAVFNTFMLFSGGLLFGIMLVCSFNFNFKLFLDNIFYVFLAASVFFRLYNSEFILGFILATTYTFGAILPTAFMVVLALAAFILYSTIHFIKGKLIPKK